MPLTYKNAMAAAERIDELAKRGLASLSRGEADQEPQLTDRIFGAIQAVLAEDPIDGLKWTAHTLSDRGPGSSESKYGADALVVLHKEVEFVSVKKGILAQAKILNRNESMSAGAMESLRDQCEKMLHLTPDSFLWLNEEEEIFVVPATSVLGLDPKYTRPGRLNGQPFKYFLKMLIDCFLGDRRFQAANRDELERVANEVNARSALLLTVKEK